MKVKVHSFYHHDTYTWSHLVICETSKVAILIDPVLDYSLNDAKTSMVFVDSILGYIKDHNITLKYIVETHAHADHLTSAAYIQEQLDAQTLIGEGIINVQETFKNIYNLGAEFNPNGAQFDVLLADEQEVEFGKCQLLAIHTPGHTNDSMSYIIGDNVFIGDTLFAPDYGSARCDFPGGNAETLYDSVQKIYALGAYKKLYLCHDYPVGGRKPQAWFQSSQQQQSNIHLNDTVSKEAFTKLRESRDKKLSAPKLIIPAIQVNIVAGQLPKPENNGITYLKTPLNTFGSKSS